MLKIKIGTGNKTIDLSVHLAQKGVNVRKYIISTDSTDDLPRNFISEHQVSIHPLNYIIKDKEYGFALTQLSSHEFYEEMRAGQMPTTCASNPEYITQLMTKKVEEGYDILHISFSSALSSSYNNAAICANEIMEEHPEAKIIVIDSMCASSGQGLLVERAVSLKEKGLSIDEVAQWVEDNKLKIVHHFTVEDLFNLMRGGRISKTTAVVGTALKIQPILHVDNEGRLENIGKVRGRKKAITTLVESIEENIDKESDAPIIVTHADSPEDALYVINLIKEKYPDRTIMQTDIGPTIGAHSGPGTMLVAYLGTGKTDL